MVERALLIVNRSSGTGCSPELPAALLRELSDAGVRELELALVEDHPSARLAACSFLATSDRPAAVIVAGGGGSLRAAVEGVADAAGGDLAEGGQVVLGGLRMGSGNVVARRLGVPRDPLDGIRALAASLRSGRTAPCTVIRCRFGTASGSTDVRHAVTMCGLGQWGRCSGDLARWHARLPRGRDALARVAGLERANHLEYVAAAGLRLLGASVIPRTCERIELSAGGLSERFRLLAGAVMNLRIAGFPFNPQVTAGGPAAGGLVIPCGGRPRRLRIERGDAVRIRLLDRESTEFFLDEDPETVHRELTLDVAGSLPFLIGSLEVAA